MKLSTLIFGITFLFAAFLFGKGNINLRDGLQTANAPTNTATPYPIATPTQMTNWPTVEGWQSPTPANNPYAAREGFPFGGFGPVVVTPAVRPEDLSYPMWATPCLPWIDSAGVLFCATATAVPPDYP